MHGAKVKIEFFEKPRHWDKPAESVHNIHLLKEI
jgi:hypothetical protein